ncbi:heterokaryon incompatibility protein-domain-containing protein [Boeremia exigua]|uniref:heterokaryon incompatibility protein-domain-containing protein n=1 Tax=Boeremia exigua TaxID=749465 RepID=UPI001E8E8CEB|nr:heterokaryon incompatibility protein-domain-containing protein [Boeremia exigua]KAH6615385.1 heterokaryon incompatibility protein-domain-containing protein [Boeremia exigua]
MASHQSNQSTAFDHSAPPSPKHRLEGHGERRTSSDTAAPKPEIALQEHSPLEMFTANESHHWKDRPGWPRLAEVMSKVPEFAAFPRFRELNMKNLLYYQVELELLHHQIEMQELDESLNIERYDTIVKKGNSAYHDSLIKLRGLLREYNEALLQLSQVSALKDPEEYNMRSLRSWISSSNYGQGRIRKKGSTVNAWGDANDTQHKGDLRTVLSALLWAKPPPKSDPDLVVTHPESKIDGLTKWTVYYLFPYWWSLRDYRRGQSDEEKQPKEQEENEQPDRNTVERMSEGAALRLTSSLSTIVACLIPVVAIVVLKQLSRTRDLLLCISGFAIVFAAGLIFLTQGTSSRTEIFAATAAFSAVMVVFISDPDINIQIAPGGQALLISENLHKFLQEVQIWAQRGFNQPLWIDAICIDQSCIVERGHQVQRMGTIYSNAQEVFVWLGSQGKLVDAFHNWLRMAHSRECPAHLRQQWDTVRFNPYWQRAWIKQEILLAKRVTVVLGGLKIEWAILGNAIARSGNLHQLQDEHAAHLWTFWDDKWTSKRSTRGPTNSTQTELFSFWSLMHMHKNADCTDKRDRIYSLLGLIEGHHRFLVNYDESVADLFWRVSEHFNAGDSPELVDILKVALLEEDAGDQLQQTRTVVNPWALVQSVRHKPDTRVRIPIRRVMPTNSIIPRMRGSVKCSFSGCKGAPRLKFTRDDLLLCTNTQSDDPTDHGCIHAIAHPLDKPAAEPFEIRLIAHHRKQTATTILLSTAIQIFDVGTETWIGISTWWSLQKALNMSGLDRVDRIRLSVPATYALMIWFGVHPDQLDDESFVFDTGLPSVHHALPKGTRITKDSIDIPGK